jgi:tetratricopeptide (TPR) repeat protein
LPCTELNEASLAVQLAQRAVQAATRDPGYWETLGIAQYRAGQWKDAAESLEKAISLDSRRRGSAGFFQAMACWQSGRKDEARGWYDRTSRWVDQNKPSADAKTVRLRAEAAQLLGIAQARSGVEGKPKEVKPQAAQQDVKRAANVTNTSESSLRAR